MMKNCDSDFVDTGKKSVTDESGKRFPLMNQSSLVDI